MISPACFSTPLRLPEFICDSRYSTVSQTKSAPKRSTNEAHFAGKIPCFFRSWIASSYGEEESFDTSDLAAGDSRCSGYDSRKTRINAGPGESTILYPSLLDIGCTSHLSRYLMFTSSFSARPMVDLIFDK